SGHGTVCNGRYCLQIGTSSRGLTFDSLISELGASGVQRAIIILDTCHSGAAIKGNKNSDILASINKKRIPKGIAVIASSKASQTSREMSDGSASVFTDLLCRGIETGLEEQCTPNGLISVENIVSYISNKLKTDKKYSSFLQRPGYKIYNAEQSIWIAKNKSGKSSKNKTTSVQQNIRTLEQLKWLYEITVRTEHPCFGASLEDLDWSLIETYAEKVHEDKGDMQKREALLARLKFFSPLADNPTLHQSAVLCFATHPERLYSQAKSNFVFDGQGDNSFERYEITGPLNSQIKELIRRTKESLRRTSSIADSGERVEKYEIDLEVIRELISNAVTHRDYQSNGVVKVTVNSDYVEIQNPGSFPDLLSWTELLKCSAYPVSKPVNGAISQYLANLVVFEGIGRGFRIIHNYITEHGKESIKFKELPGLTTSVRILRPREQDLVQGNTFTNTGGGEQNIAQRGGAIGKAINSRPILLPHDYNIPQRGENVFSQAGDVRYEEHHYHYPRTPQGIPMQRPKLAEHLVGREDLLREVLAALQPGKVVTLCGPGGIGKTALASRVAWELSPEGSPPTHFPDGLLFYSFYGRKDISMAFDHLVRSY
ncbi:MAG: hypothetical protein D3921_16005, partial [Candidatus Electrothrix sp. AW1]|nr:hypothetical protein [Candidatus Electrothrix gigas]